MATGFNTLIQTMASQDFFTGVLPFVVSYVVLYLSLNNYAPLFKDNNQMSALVSIAGAFFVARFLVLNPFYQTYFIDFFGNITLGVTGLLGLIVLLSFLGIDLGSHDYFPGPILIGVASMMAGAAFIVSGGFGPSRIAGFDTAILYRAVNYIIQSGLIWALVVGGILYWTVSEPNENDGPSLAEYAFDPSAWFRGFDPQYRPDDTEESE